MSAAASLLEPSRYLTADELSDEPRHRRRLLAVATAVEVVAACAVMLFDVGVPSLVLVLMAGLSLLVRRAPWSSLGFHRPDDPHLVVKMLGFALVWTMFQMAVMLPIANHASGHRQDLSDFDDLKGNIGLLLVMLLLGWTIAAVGEEVASRGYLQTRMRRLFGNSAVGLLVAVLVSSVLFGRIHSEQGVIGMAVVTIDGIAWSVLRYRYRTLWASVLAHGFNNTIGFLAFFLVGPIHAFW